MYEDISTEWFPLADVTTFDEVSAGAVDDVDCYAESGLLPTEPSPHGADEYLADLYDRLGFDARPTDAELGELWGSVAPDDRAGRVSIIEALLARPITDENFYDLPDTTQTTLLWGGSFEDVLRDTRPDPAIDAEEILRNLPFTD